MASSLLTLVVPVVMRGLQDGDDDVRAVAASALLPVTDTLVNMLPQYVSKRTDGLQLTMSLYGDQKETCAKLNLGKLSQLLPQAF